MHAKLYSWIMCYWYYSKFEGKKKGLIKLQSKTYGTFSRFLHLSGQAEIGVHMSLCACVRVCVRVYNMVIVW